MSKITYDAQLLKIMTLFESATRTRLKDAFYDDNDLLTFIVKQKDIGKAIGKKGSNVKRLENMLKRKIKIVAFNPKADKFIENLIYPLKAEVERKDDTIIIKGPDTKTKGQIIGRNRSNLNNMENIVQKYFDVQELKVV